MPERFEGFPPVFDENSRVLILGSFPSVKSRQQGFYYGNRQNRFWGMLARFFQAELPQTVEEKRALVLGHGVALWDVVTSCEIVGSADDSIRGGHVADLSVVLGHAPIRCVLCNGTKSYDLLQRSPSLAPVAVRKLPSTSPANPRYDEAMWHAALAEALGAKTLHESIDKTAKMR